MDGPVFDAMLKTALEEALRRDMEEAPDIPAPSRRQRKRMRRLLTGPYSGAEGAAEPETARKSRNPARWLAAVIVAALLTGAAAGLALGGGERFLELFEKNEWAAGYYKGAADAEQILDMGAGVDAPLAEAGGLRVELLDAVSDGQVAMLEVRITALDPELLERLDNSGMLLFAEKSFQPEEGEAAKYLGGECRSWELEEDLDEGQYSMLLSFGGESISAGGRCSFRLEDLVLFPKEAKSGEVIPMGPWTLSVTLRPAEVLRLEPGAVCRTSGIDWILEDVSLSPLSLWLDFYREDGGRYSDWVPYKDLALCLKNGEVLDVKGTTRSGISNSHLKIEVLFPVPLDLEQVESLRVWGTDIPLRG